MKIHYCPACHAMQAGIKSRIAFEHIGCEFANDSPCEILEWFVKAYKQVAKEELPMHHLKFLGTPNTIGALKRLIKDYPDETSFGFRNQPMQMLHEEKYDDEIFLVFQ